ncbi:MAG: 2Fe-2S iron-sulfur cluster binding domain-containing protein, partial [Alphaproteobacteria bacterium]|nr:2Fe-2S iron-sulfur cluster binding domain-containing protein [Alphaproteobacteria bacterium]
MPALRFKLNGAWRTEDDVPPAMTVLDYLRTRRHLTGTKEGCAEGDCGACTVTIVQPGARGRVDAVNSCLLSVGQLHGVELVTVEGVAGPNGGLHPVQQALVDTDGTQCGFCTPGFVMAMFAFHAGGEPARDDLIHEALAGNLC